METTVFDKDIKVFYVTASSFPEGVMAAHQKLHSLVPFSDDRNYYGVSRPENNSGIVYKAAVEEQAPGEGEKLGLESLVLKKGYYLGTTIHDYMKDTPAIGQAFQELIARPDIDPDGYCVEWYVSQTEVKCMIRLKDQ